MVSPSFAWLSDYSYRVNISIAAAPRANDTWEINLSKADIFPRDARGMSIKVTDDNDMVLPYQTIIHGIWYYNAANGTNALNVSAVWQKDNYTIVKVNETLRSVWVYYGNTTQQTDQSQQILLWYDDFESYPLNTVPAKISEYTTAAGYSTIRYVNSSTNGNKAVGAFSPYYAGGNVVFNISEYNRNITVRFEINTSTTAANSVRVDLYGNNTGYEVHHYDTSKYELYSDVALTGSMNTGSNLTDATANTGRNITVGRIGGNGDFVFVAFDHDYASKYLSANHTGRVVGSTVSFQTGYNLALLSLKAWAAPIKTYSLESNITYGNYQPSNYNMSIIIDYPINTTYSSDTVLAFRVNPDLAGVIDKCWYNLNNNVNTSLTNCNNLSSLNQTTGWDSRFNTLTVFANATNGSIYSASVSYSIQFGLNIFAWDELSKSTNLTFSAYVTDGYTTKTYSDVYYVSDSISAVPSGAVTITITADGYNQRTYYTTIAAGQQNLTLNAYLLSVNNGLYQPFIVRDAVSAVAIYNAKLTARIYNMSSGLYTNLAEAKTDSAGAVSMWLNPNTTYIILAEATGYLNLSSSVTPDGQSRTISLSSSNTTINATSMVENIGFKITPTNTMINVNSSSYQTFSWIVDASKTNDINMQWINITWNGTQIYYDYVSGFPSGTTLYITLDIHTYANTNIPLIVTGGYTRYGFGNQVLFTSLAYNIVNTEARGGTIWDFMPKIPEGEPIPFGYSIVSIFVSMMIGGAMSKYSRRGAGVMVIICFIFFAMFGWMDWTIVTLIVMTVAAILYLSGGGI